MARESRWIDPAPLEVSRPRLPWWTMLPGWVKLALSPAAALILFCWLGYQLGRVVYRYPLSLTLLLAAWWSYSGLGAWWFCALLAVLLGLLALWWWRARLSFERFAVPRVRTECRRLFVYAFEWRSVMRLSELTKDKRGREYRPKLGRVRAEGWRDLVRVRMGQGPGPRAMGTARLRPGARVQRRVLPDPGPQARPVGTGLHPL